MEVGRVERIGSVRIEAPMLIPERKIDEVMLRT